MAEDGLISRARNNAGFRVDKIENIRSDTNYELSYALKL